MRKKKRDKLKKLPQEKWYKTFLRIIKVYKPFRWKILVTFLLILLNNGFQAIAPFFIGLTITQLTKGAEFTTILWALSGVAGCYFLSALFWQLQWIWEIKYLDMDIPDYLKRKTVDHLKKLSIGQHRNEHSIVTVNKVSAGEGAIKNFCDMVFYNLVPMFVTIVSTVTIMTIVYPIVGLISIAIISALIFYWIKVAVTFFGPIDHFIDFRKSVVGKSGAELVFNMASLMVASEEDRHDKRHQTHRKYRAILFRKIFKSLSKGFFPGHASSGLGRVLILGIGSYLVFKGHYEIGAVAAILAWTNQSIGSLQGLQYYVRSMMESWADIVQYFRIMDIKPVIKVLDNSYKFDTIQGEIVFDGVFFTYPDTEKSSLAGVSFKIEPGQKVGIVGPTGAGKSTLLSLLQMAYLPDLGSIRVDGIDLSNVDQKSYRDKIGFIEQSPLILSQTLRDNLIFGLSNERRNNVSDEDLVNVLQRLELDELSSRLYANVGDLGVKISGGQKQRVVIARMLLKKPEMLVVDEGTSAVDPKTECLIHEELDNLSPGATRIFVAHRISTVQNSDQIIVMNKGTVSSIGKHEELFDRCEIYRELVQNLLFKGL